MSEEKIEKVLALIADAGNALEALGVKMKYGVTEIIDVKEAIAVLEETFNILKFDKQQGNRIGEFQVAYKKANILEKFQQAFNILNKNNATIRNRYHDDNYLFSYWIYTEKIYRQKLKRN